MSSGLPAHVEESDLISYGLIGLINAIERFDPEREIKFETYAITRIKGAIIDELRSLDWVPRSVRARAREIERVHAKLEHRCDLAADDHAAGVRPIDAAEDLQQRALATAVAPHDAQRLTAIDAEVEPVEYLQPLEAARLEQTHHVLADRVPANRRNPERFRDALRFDDSHRCSAARGDSRRNSIQPIASDSAVMTARHR